MSSVPKGVVAKIISRGYDHSFSVGEVVTSTGEDFGPHHQGVWAKFRNIKGTTQFLLPAHYEVVEVAAPKVLEAPIEKSNLTLPELEEAYKQVEVDEDLPNKVVYGVLNAEDEIYATTADRDFARELKAALGGKRKGVRIFQYAAIKEIR